MKYVLSKGRTDSKITKTIHTKKIMEQSRVEKGGSETSLEKIQEAFGNLEESDAAKAEELKKELEKVTGRFEKARQDHTEQFRSLDTLRKQVKELEMEEGNAYREMVDFGREKLGLDMSAEDERFTASDL